MKYEFVSRSNLKRFLDNLNNKKSSGGVQVAIGGNQPVDKSFWFDTSSYDSIQGTIETQIITSENFDSAVEVGNTQPTDKNIWFDTSNYSADD